MIVCYIICLLQHLHNILQTQKWCQWFSCRIDTLTGHIRNKIYTRFYVSLFCCGYIINSMWMHCDSLPKPFRLFRRYCDDRGSSKVILGNIERVALQQTAIKHNTAWVVGIILEKYSGLLGPFYEHGLTLIAAWISDHIHYKMWIKLFIHAQT